MIQHGQFDKAMELYWRIHPARQTNINSMARMAGSNFIHRMLWKYQGWLSGFNGGPLRQPTMRLVDRQMKMLRHGLVAAGLDVTTSPDQDFFIGRNPA